MGREPGGIAGRYLRTILDVGVMAGLTDGQLLERFETRGGDAAELAFAALVERHGPMVLRVCRGILRDEHDAMDAFQATFLVLVRKRGSLWVRDSLGPWLHLVACRAAGRARADAARRRALAQSAAKLMPSGTSDGIKDDLAAILHEEVERLPDRYREPIVLCDLEGRTCEEAARHLGCPVGTVGSRLARGRKRLRSRLTRLGLGPAVGALGTALSTDAAQAAMPAALAEATVQLGVRFATGKAAAGASSATAAILAEDVSRSMLMAQCRSIAAAFVTVGGVSLVAFWTFRSSAEPQAVPAPNEAKAEAAAKAKDDVDPFGVAERHKDFLLGTVGNMRPLIKDEKGVRFQSREAILYKDGTVKLWSYESKEPVGPPLRHKTAIREVTFLDEAALLITTSDDSVKVWDGLSGTLRKEIEGQVMRPLFFAQGLGASQFVTIDPAGRVVTTWDVETLKPIGTFRPEGAPRLLGAGLSKDGKTLVTIGD
ncbi:MAG TPA: sigma-70 family RNA polymerase sigma factor, partial [Isosphaeraceae bacterium]|nr:sigma-70 family RNA polymerase sigma factor [Isosphaeraceae bacterium]